VLNWGGTLVEAGCNTRPIEAANNKIKLIVRKAYGSRTHLSIEFPKIRSY